MNEPDIIEKETFCRKTLERYLDVLQRFLFSCVCCRSNSILSRVLFCKDSQVKGRARSKSENPSDGERRTVFSESTKAAAKSNRLE